MAALCVICHEPLSSSGKSCAAKCGHVLHNSCWEEWLKRKPECPECRLSTTKEDLILLFFNQESSDNCIDLPENDIDSLSSDIQNLNVTRNPKSFKEEQPELIDLADSEDEDLYYVDESEPEVVVEESEGFGSPHLRSEEESFIETSNESETDISLRADGASFSCGTGSEDSPSDETESEESGSDQSGREGSSDNEAGSEGSSGDEESASEIFLSNGSGGDEDIEQVEEESVSYETGSDLESDISTDETSIGEC